MKSPTYITAVEASLDTVSKTQLLFFTTVLSPYDNFFTPDQRHLFQESISQIESLIVRQLHGEEFEVKDKTFKKNHSHVTLSLRYGNLSVGFSFPYLNRTNGDGKTILNYFLFQENHRYMRQTTYRMEEYQMFDPSNYGETKCSVGSENSGLIEKLHSLIIVFNHLTKSNQSKTKRSIEQVDDYFVMTHEKSSTSYSLEELFHPPVLKSYHFKKKRLPNYLWDVCHIAALNALYAFISLIVTISLGFTPIINGFKEFMLGFFLLFFVFKFLSGPLLLFVMKKSIHKVNQDIDFMNEIEPSESGLVETDKYTLVTQDSILQLTFIERLTQFQKGFENRELYQQFALLARTIIKESEYNKDLFEELTPMFHLYIPTINKAINQVVHSVSSENEAELERLNAELESTVQAVSIWLTSLQQDSRQTLLGDLQKVKNHLGQKSNSVTLTK